MHDRDRIAELIAAGGTLQGTARAVGASRNAVRRAVRPGARRSYKRAELADKYGPAIRDVLADHPTLAVAQVAELIEWPASRRRLSDLVAEYRPAALERATEHLNRPTFRRLTAARPAFRVATFAAPSLGRFHGRAHEGAAEAAGAQAEAVPD